MTFLRHSAGEIPRVCCLCLDIATAICAALPSIEIPFRPLFFPRGFYSRWPPCRRHLLSWFLFGGYTFSHRLALARLFRIFTARVEPSSPPSACYSPSPTVSQLRVFPPMILGNVYTQVADQLANSSRRNISSPSAASSLSDRYCEFRRPRINFSLGLAPRRDEVERGNESVATAGVRVLRRHHLSPVTPVPFHRISFHPTSVHLASRRGNYSEQ